MVFSDGYSGIIQCQGQRWHRGIDQNGIDRERQRVDQHFLKIIVSEKFQKMVKAVIGGPGTVQNSLAGRYSL